VTSTKASARIISIDASAALAMPGVVGFIDHHSVPIRGPHTPPPMAEEEIFASEYVCLLMEVLNFLTCMNKSNYKQVRCSSLCSCID